METNNATPVACAAMAKTAATEPDYWAKCLAQRSAYESPCGSTYELTSGQLECALMASEWEEVSHPAVQAPCRVFKTTLAGTVGIVPLRSLKRDAVITIRDPKATGKGEACIDRANVPSELATTTDTYMIAGDDEGGFMCFTFHPGEPVRPSTLDYGNGQDGWTAMTVAQALGMGLEFAKVEG
jgi:hypothetical protein